MSRGYRVRLAAVLLGAVALAASAACERPRTFVTDEQGRALILHGVNVSNSAKRDPLRVPWVTREDIERLSADWGFNFVRLLVLWDALEPSPGIYDPAYIERIAERVEWCAGAGLHVVLDMHQDLYSTKFGGNGAPLWAVRDDGIPFEPIEGPWWLNYLQPAVIRSFTNFWGDEGPHADLQVHYANAWAELAARFRDHPAVVGYDIMNEPFNGALPFGTWEGTALGPFYDRVAARIRQVDPDTWIFFEPQAVGVNFGLGSSLGVVSDPRPGEPRLAYFPHFYQVDVHEGAPYDGNPFWIQLAEFSRTFESARQGSPLLFGEFGAFADKPGHLQYLSDFLAMVDRAGSGWAYWCYDPGDGGFAFIDSALQERPTIDVLVRTYPRRVAGHPLDYGYDPATRTMHLRFRTAAGVTGPTEIYVPASRHYPGGFDLEVGGPEGSWSSEWDADRELLFVTTDPAQPERTLRIAPAGG